MRIAQITDLHVGGDDVAAYYRLDTRRALRQCIDQINAMSAPIDVCLVTGDIVENGTATEYVMAREELAGLTAPWYAIPGNHDDHANFRAALADTLTPSSPGDFVQYTIDKFPLRIVALDSVIPGRGGGELCTRRLVWLEDTLAAAPSQPTLIMLHHPPFKTYQPYIDRICLARPDEFAAVVNRHRQVEAVISGHVHRAIHGRVAHAAASCCPSTAHQTALALRQDDPLVFTHEPPGFQLHVWDGPGTWTTHTVQIGNFAGPFAFH